MYLRRRLSLMGWNILYDEAKEYSQRSTACGATQERPMQKRASLYGNYLKLLFRYISSEFSFYYLGIYLPN
jgi:hypothetical protein